MRKRSLRKVRPAGHILTPKQVEQLTMPIYMALEMLPLGLFEECHAHDLAACLSIAQVAAEDARRPDLVEIGAAGARILIAMRDRAAAGEGWSASSDERAVLSRAIGCIDRFYRTQNSARWCRALATVNAMSEAGRRAGQQTLEVVDLDRGVACRV